jgi:hypothetical protein
LERDALIVEQVYKTPYSKVKKGKMSLHELRLYEKLHGYKKGWAFHTAVDTGMVDVSKDDPDAYKKVSFLISMAEKQAGYDSILKEVKQQVA